MPLMILGLVFVIGLFVFYLASTGGSGGSDDTKSAPSQKPKKDDGLKRDENVIFLPDDVESVKERRRKGRR